MKHISLPRLCALFLLTIGWTGAAGEISANEKVLQISSPNGQINVSVKIADKIYYTIAYDDQPLLENCYLQLHLKNEILGNQPVLVKQKRQAVQQEIKPDFPLKFSTVNNRYNELSLTFKNKFGVDFRVFDDGVAYRFRTDKKGEIEIFNEDFVVNCPSDYLAHMQQETRFKTAYEEPYTHQTLNAFARTGKMAVLPMLLDAKAPYKILISESDLLDYPCMFLQANGHAGLQSVFPNVPLQFGPDGDRSLSILKEADYIAKTTGARTFPWRYFVITKEDKQLIENTMTCRLASPCRIEDCAWIQPGQASWEWWNDASPYGPDVDFVSGYNLPTYKYYIDFASKYGIRYIIMDEGWAQSTLDPYTPNPEVDLFELIRYGKQKGVKIILWLTWLTVENNFDLFQTFHDWGIAGVKIDFMDRSDQWMVRYYERVAAEAAKYQLFVDFHGAFKPAGLEYVYPNILSYEGVRGMEQMGGCTPDNSAYFPYIRNAVGPMDYTPGAMLSMQPEVYASRRPNSASIGTRAYQLGLFVIFESHLQMLADNPTLYYRNSDCTQFITQVPVNWDETIPLYAKAGAYTIVAKRKDDKWFIGGMTNHQEKEREFEISLDFLPAGKTFRMTSFEDGINAARQAMDYRRKVSEVSKNSRFKIKMVRGGGWAAVIE